MSPRPGRIRGIVPIDLPQPRTAQTREDPRFFELVTQVRELLRGIESVEEDGALEEELLVAEENL
jgi:ABC-type nitrate/sulfonate/bicarbonate transport system ATPase subunit